MNKRLRRSRALRIVFVSLGLAAAVATAGLLIVGAYAYLVHFIWCHPTGSKTPSELQLETDELNDLLHRARSLHFVKSIKVDLNRVSVVVDESAWDRTSYARIYPDVFEVMWEGVYLRHHGLLFRQPGICTRAVVQSESGKVLRQDEFPAAFEL